MQSELFRPILEQFEVLAAENQVKTSGTAAQPPHPNTFYSLLFVSKLFNYETLRLIYRDITVEFRVHGKRQEQALKLLRTLCSSTTSPEHVRSLKLRFSINEACMIDDNQEYAAPIPFRDGPVEQVDVCDLIHRAMRRLRNLTTLYVKHNGGPFLLRLSELSTMHRPPFQLSVFTFNAWVDSSLWDFVSSQSSIKTFTCLPEAHHLNFPPQTNVCLLPNVERLSVRSPIAQTLFKTGPRPQLWELSVELGPNIGVTSSWISIKSVTALCIDVMGKPPDDALELLQFFPNLRALQLIVPWNASPDILVSRRVGIRSRYF